MMKVVFLIVLAAANSQREFTSESKSFRDYGEYSALLTKDMCSKIPNDILKCSSNLTISIFTLHCISFTDTNLIEVGQCMYTSLPIIKQYKDLEVSEAKSNEICKEFNREGTLCGNCRDGYYPLAYSFDMACVECPNGRTNWWKFVLVAFLPLTVFYFTILPFKINIISSDLNGFLIYSQAIATPDIARVIFMDYCVRTDINSRRALKSFGMLYGIWNLDFFRSLGLDICLELDMLQTLALDVIIGIYCLLLIITSYLLIILYDRNFRPLVVLFKPFRAFFGLFRQNWDIRTSLIDAFMTFFVMSYMKFLGVSFDLLAPVQLYKLDSSGNLTISWRLFYNASVPYFGEKHLPYGILGVSVFLFFVLLPTLLYTVYPFAWFQKLLNLFPFRWYVIFTFMDTLHGCYKDGTQPGTRDCRWFASSFLIIRFTVLLIGFFTYNVMFFPLCTIALVLFTIILINLDPFKDNRNTATNSIYLLLLGASYITAVTRDEAFKWLLAIILPVPLLYISAVTLHWMYSHRRFGIELVRRFKKHRHGYVRLE